MGGPGQATSTKMSSTVAKASPAKAKNPKKGQYDVDSNDSTYNTEYESEDSDMAIPGNTVFNMIQ